MSRQVLAIGFVCATALVVGSARSAYAQPPGASPYAGLFTGSPRDQTQTLDFRGAIFGGYDDNLVQAATGQSVGTLPSDLQAGLSTGLQASLAYRLNFTGQRTSVQVAGDADVREFNSEIAADRLWIRSFAVSSGLSTKLTNKITFSAGVGETYAPYYQYVPFLRDTVAEGSPVGSDVGYALGSDWVSATSVNATLTDAFSRHSRISLYGTYWLNHLVKRSYAVDFVTPDTETLGAGVMFTHSLTRKLGFHAGYGVQQSRFKSSQPPFTAQLVDIGLGYGDGITIQFARHYTLTLSVGASVAKNGDPQLVLKTGKQTAFFVTGAATLSRSIGRAWSTSVAYNRGLQYVLGYQEPLMGDTASAGIGGPVGERGFFSAGVGASRGVFAFTGGSLNSYNASSRLSYALFRSLGAYVQASYYWYSVPPSVAVAGLAPQLERRSITGGLTAWVPLIKPKRSHRDTR